MPKKNESSQREKKRTPPTIVFHHHKFVWNWRMLVLGILLNIATLSLVVYTVSLLNDYRQCTQGYLNTQLQRSVPQTNQQLDSGDSGALLNVNRQAE